MSSEFCLTVLVIVFQAIICSRQEKCAVLEFYPSEENVLLVPENQYVTVIFGMNVSACNNSNITYKVIVQTITSSGSLEYDGTIVYLTDTCVSNPPKSVSCITSTGPAKLYKRVNRTHVGIRWEWQWRDAIFNNFTTMRKEIKLMVAHPPRVTHLTVNGQDVNDVNGTRLFEEGQKVNISCSFIKGVPPAHFRLLDEDETEIKANRDEHHLNISLTANCAQDWSSVRCEGNSSKNNKSVSLLVRCPPQIIDDYPVVIDYETHEHWMFRVKAHSTQIEKCLLTPSSLGGNKKKEVNCTLNGTPPNLLLTLFVDKEECSKSGHWALMLFNEKGSSDMFVFSTSITSADLNVCEVNNLHTGQMVISQGTFLRVLLYR